MASLPEATTDPPLAGHDTAGFRDRTDSLFDPTTRRVSTKALKDLIRDSVDADGATRSVPLPRRPQPSPKILDEINARRSTDAIAEAFGPYLLLGSVGKGGMAEVRLAARTGAGGEVSLCVVKRIAPGREDEPQLAASLLEEARICARLEHPNIVRLEGTGDLGGSPYLAFELIDGVSLRELAEILAPATLPLPAVLEVARGATAAIAHAHEATSAEGRPLEVVHRDVTPQNILVSRDGAVKLVDFGIARFEGREHLTKVGHVKGKLGYMSPEQCRNGPLDGKSDVFSLGLVIAELVAGQRILPPAMIVLAESESLIRSKCDRASYSVPRELVDLIVRMVALERDARPSAREVLEVLRSIEGGDGLSLEEVMRHRVFSRLEPLDRFLMLDPVEITSGQIELIDAATADPTEPGYARTVRCLRPASGPGDDAETRRVPTIAPLPPPSRPEPIESSSPDRSDPAHRLANASDRGRTAFWFVAGAAALALVVFAYLLAR
jgi:serine/threonine-protein kinase